MAGGRIRRPRAVPDRHVRRERRGPFACPLLAAVEEDPTDAAPPCIGMDHPEQLEGMLLVAVPVADEPRRDRAAVELADEDVVGRVEAIGVFELGDVLLDRRDHVEGIGEVGGLLDLDDRGQVVRAGVPAEPESRNRPCGRLLLDGHRPLPYGAALRAIASAATLRTMRAKRLASTRSAAVRRPSE